MSVTGPKNGFRPREVREFSASVPFCLANLNNVKGTAAFRCPPFGTGRALGELRSGQDSATFDHQFGVRSRTIAHRIENHLVTSTRLTTTPTAAGVSRFCRSRLANAGAPFGHGSATARFCHDHAVSERQVLRASKRIRSVESVRYCDREGACSLHSSGVAERVIFAVTVPRGVLCRIGSAPKPARVDQFQVVGHTMSTKQQP